MAQRKIFSPARDSKPFAVEQEGVAAQRTNE